MGPADMGADPDGGLDAVADVPEDDATPRDTAELAMEEDAAPADVPQGEDAAEESREAPGDEAADEDS